MESAGSTSSAERAGSRRAAWALLAIVAVALVLRGLVLSRTWLELDDLVLIDDSYLSLTIARNLARGLGPWYGLAPTNGFQPLFVWLMAPVFAWSPDPYELPVRIALAGLALADIVTLLLLARVVRRETGSSGAALAAAMFWAVNPYTIATSLNGLETSLATLAVVGALDAFRTARAAAGVVGPGLRLGAWLGLAGLARIDTLLLWLLVAFGLLARRDPRLRRLAVVAAAVAVLVFAVWPVVSWRTTGTIVPVSGQAVRHMVLSDHGGIADWSHVRLPMLRRAADVVVRRNAVLLLAVIALAWLTWRARRRPPTVAGASWRFALGFAVLLTLAYAFVVFGHWHFPRYLFPWTIAGTLAVAMLLARLERTWPRRVGPAAVAIALALCLQPSFRRLFASPVAPWGYLRIGQWAAAQLPPGAVVGGSQTGAIGYVADRLVVVNLDGVVNRPAYEAMRRGRLADHVREAGVRWLVWQDDIAFLDRESHRTRTLVLRPRGRISGVRTWNTDWWWYEVTPGDGS